LVEPNLHQPKKIIKNIAQKDIAISDATVKTERLKIALDHIRLLVPFHF
jgi:hypothetical protein